MNILIVDDDEEILEVIKDLFEIFKFSVYTAISGNEAWTIVCEQQIDVIITDVRMSDGSGMELLDKVKTHNPVHPKVFFISGFLDHSLAEVYDHGVDGFFNKPFDARALRESVQSAFKTSKEKWSQVRVHKISSNERFCWSTGSESSSLLIGRGGFSGHLHDHLKKMVINDYLLFELMSDQFDGFERVTGVGQIRWIEENRVGIEIVSLDEKMISSYSNWLDQKKIRPYIPHGLEV